MHCAQQFNHIVHSNSITLLICAQQVHEELCTHTVYIHSASIDEDAPSHCSTTFDIAGRQKYSAVISGSDITRCSPDVLGTSTCASTAADRQQPAAHSTNIQTLLHWSHCSAVQHFGSFQLMFANLMIMHPNSRNMKHCMQTLILVIITVTIHNCIVPCSLVSAGRVVHMTTA